MRKMYILMVMAIALIFSATLLAQDLIPLEQLGKALYFDTNLSTPTGQSCATCHAPEVGFTGPISEINATTAVYPGAVPGLAGNRKPPTAAYAGDSPIFFHDTAEELFIGGVFWDGRATGWTLGDPLAEQAQGPFLNPLEQANSSAQYVCELVSQSSYAGLYEQVYGEPIKYGTTSEVKQSYENIARAISAYEKSSEVNPYSSKFDYVMAGKATFSVQEDFGMEVFEGAGMCNACHISEAGPNGEPPLFTDFTYDNLGVPKNPQNPFYYMFPWNPDGANWIDPGLSGFLEGLVGSGDWKNLPYVDATIAAMTDAQLSSHAADNYGKHKVPTLRNVDKRPYPEFVKAYMHNGVFKSLEETVHFYNTRDVETWPAPEVAQNVNVDELGNLGLTADEEAAIVAFMKTLSDGYDPYVFVADDDVKLYGMKNSEGNIHANENVEFYRGINTTLTGNVTAVEDVKIERRNTIDGDVSAGVEVDNKGTVTGTISECMVDAVLMPNIGPFIPGHKDIEVRRKGTKYLSPGNYAKVDAAYKATLILTSGIYNLEQLDMDEYSKLVVNIVDGEPLVINLTEEIEFHNGAEMVINNGTSLDVIFNSLFTTTMYLMDESVVMGTIMAPEARVVLGEGSVFKGSIIAEDVEVLKDAAFFSHLSTTPLPKIVPDEESEEVLAGIPTDYVLEQNYPNPFNPSTTIGFALPEVANVSVVIYNISGQVLKTLVNNQFEAGYHQVQWDGTNEMGEQVASGFYFYRLESKDFQQVKKMLMLQ